MMAEQTKSDIQDAINDIEKYFDEKNSHELKALKNTIKMLTMKHKNEILENENQTQDIQI